MRILNATKYFIYDFFNFKIRNQVSITNSSTWPQKYYKV